MDSTDAVFREFSERDARAIYIASSEKRRCYKTTTTCFTARKLSTAIGLPLVMYLGQTFLSDCLDIFEANDVDTVLVSLPLTFVDEHLRQVKGETPSELTKWQMILPTGSILSAVLTRHRIAG